MANKNITFLSAQTMADIQKKRQIDFVYQKLIEALKNFRRTCYINTDFKLEENVILYLRDLGYKVDIECRDNIIPYLYKYEISW